MIDYIYTSIASPPQRSALVQEFYGPEYALFKNNTTAHTTENASAASLVQIMAAAPPEKRVAIVNQLEQNLQVKLYLYTYSRTDTSPHPHPSKRVAIS